MGWWHKDGLSYGDEACDIVEDAVNGLITLYGSKFARRPKKEEIQAAVDFILGDYDENEINIPVDRSVSH